MASNSLAYYAVIFHHHHHSYHIIFPQESHDLMAFYNVQGVIGPMLNPQLGGPGYCPYSSLLPLTGPTRGKTHGSIMMPELPYRS